MNFSFSKHAKEQMLNRGIKDLDVIQTMKFPDKVISEAENQFIYQKIFINEVDLHAYMLRVFINGNVNPILIKTLYLTTKLSKYLI